MSDYQIQPNKKETIFYITYRTKNPEGSKSKYKKNFLYDEDGVIVSFENKERANKYRTSLRAKADAKNDLKAFRMRMNKKYGNHSNYLDSYLKQKMKEAPKSFQRSEWHMVHYVYPFFLYEKKKRNAQSWALYFDDFKDWIEDAVSIRKNKLSGDGQSRLSISSINKIIGDLNGYLDFLYKKRHLSILPPKCEHLSGAEDGYRTGDDIVTDEEYNLVLSKFDELISAKEAAIEQVHFPKEKRALLKKQLLQIQHSKSLYIVCRGTGMRISEAMGISFGDFYPRPLKDVNLNAILMKNNFSSLSYIVLKSQLGEYDKSAGKWNREPLKTKKKISLENARTIPIFNNQEECDQVLKSHFIETRTSYKISEFSQVAANEGQFLFFRHTNKNIATAYLRKIYEELELKGYKWKSFHCLRHSRSNEVISQTHDQVLVKLLLGHKSRIFERYVHLEATLAKKLTKDQEDILFSFTNKENTKTAGSKPKAKTSLKKLDESA